MRVLVTGSRNFTDYEFIQQSIGDAFRLFPDWDCYKQPVPELVHGGARGADTLCARAALWLDPATVVREFPAEWDKYGKAAGAIRNQQMADYGADLCCAFPLEDSRGTWDMVRRATTARIPVIIFPAGSHSLGMERINSDSQS